MKSLIRARVLLTLAAILLVVGCAKKPPECSDGAAVDTMHKLLKEKALEASDAQGIRAVDGDQIFIDRYLSAWSFSLSNVSTTGYNESSRTRSCRAKATLTLPDAQKPAEREVAYELQKFEDSKSGDFELRVSPDFVRFAYSAGPFIRDYVGTMRASGVWEGTTQCNNTTVVIAETQRPLPEAEMTDGLTILALDIPWIADGVGTQIPVSVAIADGSVTMTIAKADGSTLKRQGKMTPNGSFTISGKDEVSSVVPDGGFVRGDVLNTLTASAMTGRGRVKSNATGSEFDVVLRRACTLNLTKK